MANTRRRINNTSSSGKVTPINVSIMTSVTSRAQQYSRGKLRLKR